MNLYMPCATEDLIKLFEKNSRRLYLKLEQSDDVTYFYCGHKVNNYITIYTFESGDGNIYNRKPIPIEIYIYDRDLSVIYVEVAVDTYELHKITDSEDLMIAKHIQLCLMQEKKDYGCLRSEHQTYLDILSILIKHYEDSYVKGCQEMLERLEQY